MCVCMRERESFENTDVSPFGFFRVMRRTGSGDTEKTGKEKTWQGSKEYKKGLQD